MNFPDAGAYGGTIVRTDLVKGKEGQSRSFSLFVEFDERLYQYEEGPEFGVCDKFEAEIPNWIRKKDGTKNQRAIENLGDVIGFDDIDKDYTGLRVRVSVKGEEYKGRTTYKAEWLNRSDWMPGASSFTPCDPSERQQFKNEFGQTIRALNAKPSSGPAPAGKPKAPVKRAAPVAAQTETVPPTGEDIPF